MREIYQKAAPVKMILTDVDGVLTDGRLIFDNLGNEMKGFHARDGLGILIWKKEGGRLGFITKRVSEVVRRRAEELGVVECHQNAQDKGSLLEGILARQGLKREEVAFIGDDLADLGILRRVGFSAAPADCVAEVREAVDYVAGKNGGQGVLREVIEVILKARGEWERIVGEFS